MIDALESKLSHAHQAFVKIRRALGLSRISFGPNGSR